MPYLGNVPAEAYTNTVKDSFNGDGSTTAFTLSQPSTTNNLRVVVENVIQDPTVAYSCSGTTLTFTSAPPSGTANIYAVHLGPATMTAVPPTEINNATTYTSALTVQGAFTSPGIDDNATSTAMTLDSSGNLLVGTTSTTLTGNAGFTYQGGITTTSNNGLLSAIMNRNTNDGEIVQFRKDNSTVGGISTLNGDMYVAGTNKSLMFSGTSVLPRSNTGGAADATVNLGGASNRYNNIYASNGTINTSDASQKQQIASLTDDEITAAKAISKLFKTYKWNSAVEAEGDAARTHAGVVAQEVEQAMTDAGLDATQYGFFCSDTWWEADETYNDDDGVEQTRTITYDIVEEAPANATERTRLGIRYPELLAFIGAATEQRLASIEARLDALEAV